jgi:hypothetical protein
MVLVRITIEQEGYSLAAAGPDVDLTRVPAVGEFIQHLPEEGYPKGGFYRVTKVAHTPKSDTDAEVCAELVDDSWTRRIL